MLVHCIDRDIKALASLGKTGFLKIVAVTHTGITTDDFLKFVASSSPAAAWSSCVSPPSASKAFRRSR